MAPPPLRTAALLATPEDAEAQFYEALHEADLERLMGLWIEDEGAVCVHPGGTRLVGTAAIRAGFEAIFANGPIRVRPEQVRRLETADAAVHSVLERFDVTTSEGPRTGWVLATNVYVRTALGWRLAAHHASPGAVDDSPADDEPPAMLH